MGRNLTTEPTIIPCKSIFSNGMEFSMFEETQCCKCTRYRNGKCRIYTAIIKAMLDESFFPYDDLLDWDNGYGGKACKSFTDKPLRRKTKQTLQSDLIDGQQMLNWK